MTEGTNQSAPAVDDRAAIGLRATLANVARVAGPPLLFGFRLWASVCTALFVAFWLQLDDPHWAGTSAAIVCQQYLGASLRKARYRIIGTVVGAVTVVILAAWFPQDRVGFLVGLALWSGICAFGATLFRNFASYAAALAGYTAAIIAAGILGATGGASSEVFMLAVTRASEISIGILSAGLVLAGSDFGAAPRRLAAKFAEISGDIAAGFRSSLEVAGSESFDAQTPVRRELIRQVVALDPVIDQAIGESSKLRYHSPVLEAAVDGLFGALAAWRGVLARLGRSAPATAKAEAEAIMRTMGPELRSVLLPGEAGSWMTDPVDLQRRYGTAVRGLVAMPANTPSLRLLTDQTANVLAGLITVLEALAVLVVDPARVHSPGRNTKLYVPDWLPPVVNAGRAFAAIGAVELFWVVTGWPNGGIAIVFVTVVVLLLSPRGELAFLGSVALALGTIAAIPIAAAIKFAAFPAIETFPAFCLILGAFFIPVGAAMVQSRQPGLAVIWTALAINLLPILQPANQLNYNTAQFYNSALAIFVGCVVGPILFLLVPPLSPAFRTKRLLDLTLRDLGRLAIESVPMDARSWRGRIHSRLTALPDSAEPLQRAQLLAALSVGTEIIHLRQEMVELDLGPELDLALENLAQGNSTAATAQLASLDRRVASIVDFGTRTSLALRTRGRILLISDALAEHRAYFDTGGPG
ncbi:putative membrane protein YccC [Nitrobacteraceae bacterium AZCC 2161]